MSKKFLLFLFFILFQKLFAVEVIPGEYGSEWDPGMYPEVAEINRFLPVASFMRAMSLIRVAKTFVKRDDFLIHFDALPESEFKNELRRQYYLDTKGTLLDKTAIGFSVLELFNSGLLDGIISNANKDGVLNLSAMKISSLDGLNRLLDTIDIPVKYLNLSKNELSFVSVSCFSLYFSRLEELILASNSINELQPGCFDNLINLKFIDLGQNYITNVPEFIFSNCAKLRKIDLSDNSLRVINKNLFFGLEKHLQEVNLADNNINRLSKDSFANFKNLINVYL